MTRDVETFPKHWRGKFYTKKTMRDQLTKSTNAFFWKWKHFESAYYRNHSLSVTTALTTAHQAQNCHSWLFVVCACFWQLTLVCQWLQTNAMVYRTGTDRESPSYKWSLCDVTGHNKKSLLDGFFYFCMFFLFHRENRVKCIGPYTKILSRKMFPILKRTFVFCISVIRWLWLPAVLSPFNLSNHLISGHY